MGTANLAIVVPAFNESSTIKAVVTNYLRYGAVIVVDDGSVDDTAALAKVDSNVHVLRYDKNMGYEYALKNGFLYSLAKGFEYILTMDADGELPHELIPVYLNLIQSSGVGMVLGKRDRLGRATEIIFDKYFSYRVGAKDILCGMKMYRRELLASVMGNDEWKSVGAVWAYRIAQKSKFLEVEVKVRPRNGQSRYGGTLKGNFKVLWSLFRFFAFDLQVKR